MATAADEQDQQQDEALPPGWINPVPARRYDLVVIGGTRGGVAAAVAASQRGLRVALATRQRRYEDNRIRWLDRVAEHTSAHNRDNYRSNGDRGCHDGADFSVVSGAWQQQLQEILPIWELLGYGVDVFFGRAEFSGPRTLHLDGVPLEFRRAVLAGGLSDEREPAEGEADWLTPAGLAALEAPPRRLLVLGDGAQACEIAQTFCRLGSEVHLLSGVDGILPAADDRAVQWLLERLLADGVRLYRGWTIASGSRSGRWQSVILQRHGQRQELIADYVVDARCSPMPMPCQAGRDRATLGRRLVSLATVADQHFLLPSAAAVGCMAADHAMARWPKRPDPLAAGWLVDTDPQIVQLGLSSADADRLQIPFESHWTELSDPARPASSCGVAIVRVCASGRRVLGITIAAPGAARLARELVPELRRLRTRRFRRAALAADDLLRQLIASTNWAAQ